MRGRSSLTVVLLGLFCLSLCLAGCEKTPETPAAFLADASDEAGMMGVVTEVPGGRLMMLGESESILVYFDYTGKTFVPICTRADCAHEPGDKNCPAGLLAENLVGICVYQGQLWYLKESFEGRQNLSDPVVVMLCRADLTGENAEELYTWQMTPNLFGSVLYNGCYYVIDQPDIYDESGQYVGLESRIIRVDLESGAITEIEEKEEAQKTLYYIMGFREGNLYYNYYPGDRYPNGAVVRYDCETGEKEALSLREGDLHCAFLDGNYLLYMMEEEGQGEMVCVMDLTSGEEIARIPNEQDMGASLYGDEILFSDLRYGYARYDLKTGEYQPEIRDAEFANLFQAVFWTGDGYVGRCANEEGFFNEYAYISREDFDRGGRPTPLTKDGWPIR